MFIIKSLKKTSAMRRLMILMNEPYGNSYKEMTEHSNKIGYEFERLYLSMKEIPALSELLDKYNIDAEELRFISYRILCSGYNCYKNREFLPISLVSFYNPLEYILKNFDKFSNYSNKEVMEVVQEAEKLLWWHCNKNKIFIPQGQR